MKWELFMSGTAPCLSTLCLPDVTACDQISQAFSLCICILQANKYWNKYLRWERCHNHRQLNLKHNKQDGQYTLLSKPICAKDERNGPPSDNQGPPVPNPRHGCAIISPCMWYSQHWYSIVISTYGGTTSSCTTDHGSVAQDGLLLILELELELCPPVSGSLSLMVGISILRGCTSKQHLSNHPTPRTCPWCLQY